MSAKAKTPVQTAARKDESRHHWWWYPSRCEKEGCDVTDKAQLQKCSACRMVQYCCREHQREDWKLHKEECKVFQRVGLRATFYYDDDMLKRYPLKSANRAARAAAAVPAGSSCELCGQEDSEVEMTRTACCGNVICNTGHRYELMTFSREFCPRSHKRYTLCGRHGEGWDHNTKVDWRECDRCIGRDETVPIEERLDVCVIAGRLWHGLNSYNYCPLLSKDVPRHGLCDVCDVCNKKYMSCMEGCTAISPKMVMCRACAAQQPQHALHGATSTVGHC